MESRPPRTFSAGIHDPCLPCKWVLFPTTRKIRRRRPASSSRGSGVHSGLSLSVLRPIKVVASTYLYLCIWSIVGIGQHVVSFSHSNLLIVAIWPEWIFPCKVPEDREEQYLCV